VYLTDGRQVPGLRLAVGQDWGSLCCAASCQLVERGSQESLVNNLEVGIRLAHCGTWL
jgi:hypothetical protein